MLFFALWVHTKSTKNFSWLLLCCSFYYRSKNVSYTLFLSSFWWRKGRRGADEINRLLLTIRYIKRFTLDDIVCLSLSFSFSVNAMAFCVFLCSFMRCCYFHLLLRRRQLSFLIRAAFQHTQCTCIFDLLGHKNPS